MYHIIQTMFVASQIVTAVFVKHMYTHIVCRENN